MDVAKLAEVRPRATLSALIGSGAANQWGLIELNTKLMDSSGFVIVDTGHGIVSDYMPLKSFNNFRFGLPNGNYLMVVTHANGLNVNDARIAFRIRDVDTGTIYGKTNLNYADTDDRGKQSGPQSFIPINITAGPRNLFLDCISNIANTRWDDLLPEPAAFNDSWTEASRRDSNRIYTSLDIYKLK